MMLSFSNIAIADEKSSLIINNTVKAYGGKQLTELKTLTVEDKYKSFRFGQSASPDEIDLVDYHSSVSIDFKSKRNSFQWRRGGKKHFSTQHQVFDGQKGYSIGHSAQTITENTNITYYSADRRHIYFLDTAMAVLMNQSKMTASYSGETIVHGVAHDKITFKPEGYPELTVFIDRETGLISKMQRAHWRPNEFFFYNYSDQEQTQGIIYASNTYVTRNGQPYSVTVSRKVQANQNIDHLFELPKDYGEVPATIDFSKMTVKKIAPNTYLAGMNWGFSIFVDAGDYFIGAGGYRELSKRFEAMKEFSGKDKPLKYQVVSHHHLDHLGGMKEAAELGVQFITVKAHINTIREVAGVEISDDRFVTVDKLGTFAGGLLKVMDYPNGHSTHNLMSYFSQSKVMFTADFYFSRQKEGVPNGYEGLKKFQKQLAANDFDVDYFAAAHSGRVLKMADFKQSLIQLRGDAVCPKDWNICKSD